MTPEQFCYWLQGFFEISNGDIKEFSKEKTQIIQDHLALVFSKVTPNRKETSLEKFLKSDDRELNKTFGAPSLKQMTVC